MIIVSVHVPGWSGGAMVLGKLLVPGRPTNLDYSRARAYCACSRCGWGLFGHFFSVYHFSFLSPSLWETARYRLKYCLKGPFSPKQLTNHVHVSKSIFISELWESPWVSLGGVSDGDLLQQLVDGT